jgi:hypothetical protein
LESVEQRQECQTQPYDSKVFWRQNAGEDGKHPDTQKQGRYLSYPDE